MAVGAKAFCILILLASLSVGAGILPQEVRVNQKKIERDRAKKKKQDMKYYENAVKRHNKIQSKSTKSSMKKTKKGAKKNTPSMR
jgi:hypothetical protein